MKRFSLLILCLTLTGCIEKNQQANTGTKIQTTVPDGHSSQNSLDWAGTYSGIPPCASCRTIKMEIVLKNDGRYEQTGVYEYDGESDVVFASGSFSWNESGSTITLNNAEKPNQFFVGENYLVKLDMNGNQITGDLADKYILTKNK
ncbi:copper resistance protein NlpE [Gracilimonas sp. Q87]|uniref:copper resistance protein NlpE n=1 Tax=Gracilimonas sp. Q87 TaxID=3384766 RepID=UPI003983F2E0